MAEINEDRDLAFRLHILRRKSLAIAVPTSGNTTLLELIVDGIEKLSVHFDVSTANLDAFLIQGRVNPDAGYDTIASVTADYTTAKPTRILATSGDLTGVAAAASGSFDMDVSGLQAVKILASAVGSPAAVSIYANGTSGGAAASTVTLTAGDIEIGAVEIKDGTTDTRAVVGATGLIVGGSGYSSQPTITRPADTTAYTAGDVVGGVTTFASMGAAAGHIIITDVDYRVDLTAVPALMTSFRLHLYNATPPSALGDNAVWDLPAGDRASYLGYIDLGSPVDVGATLFVQTSGVNKKLLMGATTSLFGYLVTNGGYTPASATTQAVRLNAVGV